MNSHSTTPLKASILIADDTLDNLRLLSDILTQKGYKVRGVRKGERVISAAELSAPDLILLDILMPEINGYEVCRQLKASPKTRDIPVIFLSALKDTSEKVKAFAVGGVDYITKPFQIEEVLARVENQLHLKLLQKQLSEQNSRLQQEIRERQLLEDKLHSSETEIRAFFEAMNDVVLILNTQEGNLKVAPTNTARFYPPEVDILSLTIEQFFLEEKAPIFKSQVERALAEQKLVNFEYSLEAAGEKFWFTASITPTSENTVTWVARDIRDRKKVEAALRHSEKRFRSLVENIPGVIYRCACDGDWTMQFISDAVEEISGYPANDFIKNKVRSWASIIHPDDRLNVQISINKSVEIRQAFVLEYRIIHACGSIRWVYEKGQASFQSDNLLCLDGAIFDITERKQQEQALQLIVEGTAAQTGLEFFRSCVRYLAIVLRVRYALVSQRIYQTTKVRTLAFWTGETWSDDVEYELASTPCEKVLAGQCCYYPDSVQKRFPEDQELIDLGVESYLGIPLLDSTGQILGHLSVMDTKPMINDTNQQLILRIFAARAGAEIERKLAEQALEHRAKMDSYLSNISRAFLDREFESALNFILKILAEATGGERSYLIRYSESQIHWSVTHEWYAETVSPAAPILQNISIYAAPWIYNQLSNKTLINIPKVANLPPEANADRSILEKLSIQSLINIPLLHRNELIGCLGVDAVRTPKAWSEQEINLLKVAGEIITIALARHEAELAQQHAAEAALAANKAKSEFLANMSHELRTPLTAILGLSEALRDEVFGPLTTKQHQKLATIEQSGQHLLELINDVLDLAKIESGKMDLQLANTDILGLCQASLAFVRQQAYQKQIKLSSQISPHIKQVELDERRIRQVLINLLSNAVKFTPEGGQVWIEVNGNLEQEVLNFTIADTGIGISAENITKLFKPFVQLDSSFTRRYAGTGLGLALVRQVVELHGGSVSLESEVGQGSRFTVSLPWKLETKKSLAEPANYGNLSINLNQVLIVEDSPPAAEQIALYLSQLNVKHCEIHPLGTGTIEEAIKINPDAIILDLQLPDRSGWDVLAQLKTEPRTQNIPILIVSVADEPAKIKQYTGPCEYLLKPFSAYQFQIALRKLLAVTTPLKTPLPAPQNNTPLILLAEDNEANISTIVEYLEIRGYRLATAFNGVEAVQMTQHLKPDLILMDIQMPEMDGLEATRLLRASPELAKTPIIALTSLAMPGDREKCFEAGVNEYLAKPVSLKKLAETIAQQIAASQTLPQSQL
ncbi:response regulator [Ancylothrix sp. C2]|uniref:response regulator n=1 Tax=Ancylothrix sp. D3o TaxID=2953691 RepID=UPI0021BA99BD|nr:response regulator [Ancylothrix sp. D3o]MCT7952184.1 response regulator [Ancylothrix sp. D3o]